MNTSALVRRAAAVAIALALAAPAFAQSKSSSRLRATAPADTAPSTGPSVTVTSPQSGSGMTTSASTVTLGGTVVDTDGVNRIEWVNNRGGSGVATVDPIAGTFTIAGQSGSDATLFSHDFTSASDQALELSTPQVGMGWSQYFQYSPTALSLSCQIRQTGTARPTVNENDGALIICRAIPSAAVNAALNYTLTYTIAGAPPSGLTGMGGAGDAQGIVFGGVDANNWCGLRLYNFNANPDVVLFKRSGGTYSDYASGSANAGTTDNDVFTLTFNAGNVTVTRNGVTIITKNVGTDCNGTALFGMHFGATTNPLDDSTAATAATFFSLVDHAAATASGIALQSGTNIITLTAYDSLGNSTVTTYTIQQQATDTQAPTISLLTPVTGGNTHTTSATTVAFTGTASDAVGPITVTYQASGANTVAAGTAVSSQTGTSTAVDWTLSRSWVAGTTNLTFKATDGNANQTTVTATLVINTTDTTPPTISITSPSAEPYASPTSTVTLTGSASDAVGLATPAVRCSNDRGGAVDATGANPWTCTGLGLFNGTNIITARATDTNNNQATATRTVNYVEPLVISTGATLPTGIDNTAYGPALITATGGNGPGSYVWTEAVPLSSDVDCAGLVFADIGGTLDQARVSGTPTAPVAVALSCTFRAQVNDGSTTVTKDFTITLNPAGSETSHSFFETQRLASYCSMALSGRPGAGATNDTSSPIGNCAHPHYINQLLRKGLGGFGSSNSATHVPEFSYSPGTDTDPDKQDAMKISIPPFTTPTTAGSEGTAVFTVGATVPADASVLTISIAQPNTVTCSFYNSAAAIKIDDEIMGIAACSESTNILTVDQRAMFGSPLQSHAVGTRMERNLNSLPDNLFVRFGGPLPPTTQDWKTQGAGDGRVHVFTWDSLFTNSYRGNGQANYKCINFWSGNNTSSDAAIWGELNCVTDVSLYNYGTFGTPCPNAGDPSIYVFNVAMRTYNQTQVLPGITSWPSTTGDQAYPTVRGDVSKDWGGAHVQAQCVKHNEWARWFLRIKQVSQDWDEVTVAVGTESRPTVVVIDKVKLSVRRSGADGSGIIPWVVWPQLNTSTDSFVRGTVGGNPDGLRNLVSYWRNLLWLSVPIGDTTFDDGNIDTLLYSHRPVRD